MTEKLFLKFFCGKFSNNYISDFFTLYNEREFKEKNKKIIKNVETNINKNCSSINTKMTCFNMYMYYFFLNNNKYV